MRTNRIVDYILRKLPKEHLRWCPIGDDDYERSGCACLGCVVHVVTKEEWLDWCKRYNYCDHCKRFDEDRFYT
jgi:hypothetical protein